MKTKIKENLDKLQLTDVYSLLLFILYKVQDIPEYKTLSELCYLLDGNSLIRTLTYYGGKTITIPKYEDFTIVSSALLVYQYVNLDGYTLPTALSKFKKLTDEQKGKVVELYLKIIPIMKKYVIDKEQIQHGAGLRKR